jgi:hypothetical protein
MEVGRTLGREAESAKDQMRSEQLGNRVSERVRIAIVADPRAQKRHQPRAVEDGAEQSGACTVCEASRARCDRKRVVEVGTKNGRRFTHGGPPVWKGLDLDNPILAWPVGPPVLPCDFKTLCFVNYAG